MKRFLLAATACLMTTTAFADDWQVTRLRGDVFALDAGQWVQLARGDVVSDDRYVQSAPDARATFARGPETIEIGADTIIQIMDREGRRYTTVAGHRGEINVDVEALNVEHFSVVTPHMAAIVKGTAFSVFVGPRETDLSVSRGLVSVRDTASGTELSVAVGQSVSSGEGISPVVVTASPGTGAGQPAVALHRAVLGPADLGAAGLRGSAQLADPDGGSEIPAAVERPAERNPQFPAVNVPPAAGPGQVVFPGVATPTVTPPVATPAIVVPPVVVVPPVIPPTVVTPPVAPPVVVTPPAIPPAVVAPPAVPPEPIPTPPVVVAPAPTPPVVTPTDPVNPPASGGGGLGIGISIGGIGVSL